MKGQLCLEEVGHRGVSPMILVAQLHFLSLVVPDPPRDKQATLWTINLSPLSCFLSGVWFHQQQIQHIGNVMTAERAQDLSVASLAVPGFSTQHQHWGSCV